MLGKQHSAEGAHCVPGAVDQPIGAAHYAGAHQQNPVEEHNLLWSTPGTQLRKHALFEHIDGTESKRVTSVGEHLGREATKAPSTWGTRAERQKAAIHKKHPLHGAER